MNLILKSHCDELHTLDGSQESKCIIILNLRATINYCYQKTLMSEVL